MKCALLFAALTGLAIQVSAALPAAAPAAAPTPMGFDKIAAAFDGSWNVESDDLATIYSKAKHSSFTAIWECHRSGPRLICAVVSNGRLATEYVFVPGDAEGSYKLHFLRPQTATAEGAFSINGDSFVLLLDIPNSHGDIFHYRLTRKYTSADAVETKIEIKRDPSDWVTTLTGKETRTGAAGPAPATAMPALDALVAGEAGAWTSAEEDYSSEISEAGSKTTVFDRDCWRDGAALKCLVLGDDKLLAELIFSYDVASGVYQDEIVGGPHFTFTIKGNTWSFLGDSKNKQGDVMHLRETKVFKTPDSVESRREFKHDTGDWITYATLTETRKSAGP